MSDTLSPEWRALLGLDRKKRAPAKKWTRCQGSYAQVALSVAQEASGTARCPHCGKDVNVRPTRNNPIYAPGPSANIPAHKETGLQRSSNDETAHQSIGSFTGPRAGRKYRRAPD